MTVHESPARPLHRLALGAAALAAALLLGSAEVGAGALIEVNTTAAAGDDGKCSLEEAIQSANSDKAVDVCTEGAGDDQVDITVPGEITAPAGGFQITSNMTIQGNAGGSTIKGGDGFDVVVTAESAQSASVTAVTLADLTLVGPGGHGRDVGVDVKDETASAVQVGYTVTLENLHIRDHSYGVRVEKDAEEDDAHLGRPGHVLVKDSVVEGAPFSRLSVYLEACDWVAPFHEIILTISNSVIGNGVAAASGGIGAQNRCGYLKVVDSTIAGIHGGVSAFDGKSKTLGDSKVDAPTRTEIINSTITNYLGTGVALTTFNSLQAERPELSVVNSTISGSNTGETPGNHGIRTSISSGDRGVFDVEVFNSVVAGNGGSQCSLLHSLADGDKGGNVSSDASCGFGRQSVAAGLGVLADNGGARAVGPNGGSGNVLTMAIDKTSPLFNAVSGSDCPHARATKDARGVLRPQPQEGACDVGAYEAKYVTVKGVVWSDGDGDGAREDGEGPIKGVKVELVDGSGAVVGRDTTGDDGGYSFEVLLPGTWTVRVPDANTALAGHRAITPVSVRRELGLAASGASGLDFGYQRLSAVTGTVWVDTDKDGVRDEGEAGLKGVAVRLLRDGSQAGSAETKAGGVYELPGLAAGSYVLVVTAPVGYAFTARGAGSNDSVDSDVDPASGRSSVFTLAPGSTKKVDAGVFQPKSKSPGKDPDAPAPLLSLVKSASGKAPVGAGDAISYSFLVSNRGNVTLSRVSVADPKAGVVSCPGTVLAPEGSMTCTASYEASAADEKAGKVVNTATVTGSTVDGVRVSATDSAPFDLGSGGVSVDRLAGKDRYGTASVISEETFTPGVDVVYVATGVNFPDALAGSAASGGSGPILLVTKDSIPSATLAELRRLKPKRIVVLGGTGVVSEAVEAALGKHAATARQAGADRYSTAAMISASHFGSGAAVVFVATGADFPDALTGGPAAAKAAGPILLTQKDKLPSATVSELKRLKPKRIVVLGGTGVVSDAVEKALASYTSGKVSRLAGPDRYSTGGAISKDGFDRGAPVVYVATGQNFPDALAGGAAGAFKDGPVLLVSGGSIPKATQAELTRLKPKRVVVLGGAAVVPESVEKALAAYIR